jgi:ABC-type transport system involved in multi-copper enzyme maturation permease subunit
MNDLVAVEWLKLRTTHLLHGMIPATLALSFAAVAGQILSADDTTTLASSGGVREVLSLTGTGAVMVLLVGIVISAGEHRHGTAADTFLTTPRRHQVMAAKLAFGALLGVAAGILTSLACVGLAIVLYEAEGVTFPLGDPEVWLTLGGTLVYTTYFALLGVAIGALARNQTLAISIALAWLAVVEHLLVGLAPDIGRWLPVAAGQAIVRTPVDNILSPAAATAVLTAYTAALAVAGLRAVVARDV